MKDRGRERRKAARRGRAWICGTVRGAPARLDMAAMIRAARAEEAAILDRGGVK